MSQVAAIAAAFFYGFADFAGGTATKRLSVWRVTAWSQLLGVPLLVVGLLVAPAPEVTRADVLYGALAGLFGLFGLVWLYLGLARGTMSVVAPISGAVAASVPVLFDVLVGSGLDTRQWVGVGLALAAVALVGWEGDGGSSDRWSIAAAVIAGVAFGFFFIAMGQTEPESGLWPLAAARTASIPIAFAIAAASRAAAMPGRGDLGLVALIGNLDMAANVGTALALQRGPTGVTSVLIALSPAVTAATAMVLLRERPRRVQLAGIVAALAAVVALVG